ncbi:ATP-binding cassette domain-containing protein [Kyrpidia spormannii]|uniref:Oligopeptide ABC transporter (ATP-binding protein) n=1 Tax=Kyrpidia spormannii TaxID=2055160 RepID=A0ACA8ZD22_9BACL|nr:ATP-binding cassette domain-containing protein [Kyrpidia spormannii]CAB3394748.1 oligopeptide ABC transporter (ATP-binding protein) [Kyrpidia spormannii]
MTRTEESILTVRALCKTFRVGGLGRNKTEIRAVDGVSFDVAAGESLGLIGESGSGKSTLGRLIAGLLQPDSGEIVFRGKPAWDGAGARTHRRVIQIVFQDSGSAFNPRLPIDRQILEPFVRHHRGVSLSEARARVARLLEVVGLTPGHGERYPHELSGGQRQRAALARALAVEPELLVLDEPVSALDVSVRAQIVQLLVELRETYGLTYLFIAHNLDVVAQLCHRVAVMYRGKIVELAEAESLYRQPTHPYSRMLLSSVLTVDGDLGHVYREAAGVRG